MVPLIKKVPIIGTSQLVYQDKGAVLMYGYGNSARFGPRGISEIPLEIQVGGKAGDRVSAKVRLLQHKNLCPQALSLEPKRSAFIRRSQALDKTAP